MNASRQIEQRADDLAPAVIDSLSGLVRFLARPWVRKIIKVVLFLLLGGLPAWVLPLVDFLLQMAPAMNDDVVRDLKSFRQLVSTLGPDTPPDVARHLKPGIGSADPFKNPRIAAIVAGMVTEPTRGTVEIGRINHAARTLVYPPPAVYCDKDPWCGKPDDEDTAERDPRGRDV